MPIKILMPALSPTMEKGNLARWLKKEGDAIKSGDVIAEIETDKATMEVEAVDEGVLAKIVVPEGSQDVKVNELIALIAGDGEDAKAVASGARASAPPAAPAAAPKTGAAPAAAAPAAPSPAPAPVASPAPAKSAAHGARVFASPLARRLAKEAGLDLSAIAGSGPHGRVVERDVKAAIAGGGAKKAPAPQAASSGPALAPGMSDETIKKLFEPGTYEEVPHDSMRKVIAKRLVEAKQTIPHFYLTVDCKLDALLAAREAINAAAPKNKDKQPAYKISVNDFVIKAFAMALQRVPEANVTYTENTMLKHRHSDVAVAVSIPGGLITPVVRKAETKGLAAISNEMKDLATRARARKLQPQEYQGGSTAVSNLGMFGIKNFQAVINPPHATILAVGAGEERVIVEKGQMKVATMMSVTLSTDHRAVDGALGAELIAAFKDLIENPVGMLV
ncbi:MAG: pyruvate dehydrogenase complex dihydrolipoamide acetyltransferase [Beijerinckiaceae bacterium]